MPILACSTSFLLSLGVLGLLSEPLESAASAAQTTGKPGAELTSAPAAGRRLARPLAGTFPRAGRTCLVALRPSSSAAAQAPARP